MKRKHYILLLPALLCASLFSSCNELLDVENDRYTYEEDFRMQSAHDTLYAMVGILSQLQYLGDSYVLLGELRGDLMETTPEASRFLKEINNFSVSSENPYLDQTKYYAIINSCNYVTNMLDTSYTKLGDKAMMRTFAAAKSIRAWTYMQLALNFDTVSYYSHPIVQVSDTKRPVTKLRMSSLADSLIADLTPVKDVQTMYPGTYGSFYSPMSIFPIKFLLGDLYLWKKDYENAAKSYYDLMISEDLVVYESYSAKWAVTDKGAFSTYTNNWKYVTASGNGENLCVLASSPDYGSPFTLDSLSYNYLIAPTQVAINKWNDQIYFERTTAINEGDLRQYGSYYHVSEPYLDGSNSDDPSTKTYITKYQRMNTKTEKCLIVYRTALLYLRYAEAVNRLGCPQLAFAILKTGLTPITSTTRNLTTEIQKYGNGATPGFMNFQQAEFTYNYGIHRRGCGNTHLDSTYFNIPRNADTITYVENKIVEELALEMAFEGNRYHDLMRVAIRRDDPAFLADRISSKYPVSERDRIKTLLLDEKNWYLRPGN